MNIQHFQLKKVARLSIIRLYKKKKGLERPLY